MWNDLNCISKRRAGYAGRCTSGSEASFRKPTIVIWHGVGYLAYMNENVENPISGVTYVVVSEMKAGKVNPQRLSGNTKGELTWLNNIPRVWEDKHYLYPIPDLDIIMNPNLTQNPGW